MPNDAQNVTWVPTVKKTDGPMYLSIADAIEGDIQAGVLKPGQRLPPQRALATALNIDFTTVSRAYAAAGKKGLVEGRVGQGTYVKDLQQERVAQTTAKKDQPVDMSMNMPPRFENEVLFRKMWDGFQDLGADQGENFLMRYQRPGGSAADCDAGQRWLHDSFGLSQAGEVVLCNGVQGAVLSIASLILKPGDTVCCEELTYPGFLAVAKYLDLKVVSIAMDDGGLDPDALAKVCKEHQPVALYTTPTLHNPTATTLSSDRRSNISEIARIYNLTIIEDNAYGALATDAPPPLAHFAPELTWHVASTSKCLAPSLRVCFVLPPEGVGTEGIRRAISANGGIVSPISAGLATTWINSGLAPKITSAIRTETQRRQETFRDVLPSATVQKDAFHIWLPIPKEQSATELLLGLRGIGIGLVPGRAFAVGNPPNAIRVALGSADNLKELRADLRSLADALDNPQESSWMVV
ncbi:2-aminoadipate transaminase [Planktotalea frisia]|uniref:2-aminoadipate transaminase n=2 Tax=Planktotalea frisia TaxID=696762 RepID=A0A1L9NZF9_9RHOB|nr:PLP-dependent aminotransferase family protein [Paracoccaceae bacterium]OJI94636.1 2-aminoadipate transaminase [Planktotalea frisia]